MQYVKNTVFRELRFGVIFDYTPKLRPFGEKIKDFFLMSLNTGVFHILNQGFQI